jgi:methionyl-tRNA synthetase
MIYNDETKRLLADRQLEQTCPACGEWSAATWHCFSCGEETGPIAWHKGHSGPPHGQGATEPPKPDTMPTAP